MRIRSHRWRLTLWAAAAAGVLLTVVLSGVYLLLGRLQADAADDLLESVLLQVLTEPEQNGEWHDPEEFASLHPGLSVAVYLEGKPVASYGARLPLATGDGFLTVAGRVLRYKTMRHGGRVAIAALDWQDQSSDQRRLLVGLAIILPATVALVGWVAWSAAGATFRPLLRMAGEAESMAADPGSRLPVPEDQEFGYLASRLNGFLDRLESNLRAQERFASDAAHEMRTPLTVIRGHFETALLHPRSAEEYEAVLRLGVEETERLSALVNLLLESAAPDRKPPEPLDCDRALLEARLKWLDAFRSAGVELGLESEPIQAVIWESELACVLDNLLANALRFSPPSSTCGMVGRNVGAHVMIEVRDEGPGVPPGDREQIFERFVRLDEGRNRQEGGFGIGLAVAKTIVERRGGTIVCEPNEPSGCRFMVSLPIA